MHSWCCGNPKLWKNCGLLALRIAVGAIFIYNGYAKLTHVDLISGAFASWGYPYPVFFTYLVGLIEFFGGLAVLLGIYTRIAAKFLAFDMLMALLTVHWRLGQSFQEWELPLALLGASLALVGLGAGHWRVMQNDCCGCGGQGCGCGPQMPDACSSGGSGSCGCGGQKMSGSCCK